MEPIALEPVTDGVLLRVRVQPKASRNALSRAADGRLRVAITAPPVDGKANQAVVRYVAQCLKVKRSAVTIHSGLQSRDKCLCIADGDVDTLQKHLSSLIGE